MSHFSALNDLAVQSLTACSMAGGPVTKQLAEICAK